MLWQQYPIVVDLCHDINGAITLFILCFNFNFTIPIITKLIYITNIQKIKKKKQVNS